MNGDEKVKALKAAITKNVGLGPAAGDVEVTREGDALVVAGEVDSISRKKRILLLAMGVEGVSGVVDRLTVRPAASMTDDEIRSHLADAFAGEPAMDERLITVEIRNGVVDIEGRCPSLSHKRLAGVLAWWVPGVRDVINSLEVTPPEEDSDDELRDALRLILEKDRLVDASHISVEASNWVVTLRGVVSSEAEKDAAECDAWYTWGVNDVVNRLEVRPAAP
ncbi:MAG TPA: BON domain-containing protein [Deltaproteobacteria bacterium]|nr:BON domain-containing protein [Deltaproteobacteria bacterium]